MPFVTTCVRKFSTTLRVLKSIELDMVIVTWCHMIVTCVRKFPTTEGFKKHRMRHGDSNDMSYDCNLCQNDFHHSQGFKKHCLRHGDGNEMPYDCDLCRNVSTNLRVLKSIGWYMVIIYWVLLNYSNTDITKNMRGCWLNWNYLVVAFYSDHLKLLNCVSCVVF